VDFYQGVADWRIIRRLVQKLKIPVVGNGDIWYAEDALRMKDETGVAAVMLGRPVLRNPWIFCQIEALAAGRTPPRPDGRQVTEHVRLLADEMGQHFTERSTLGMLKEQMRYLCRALFAQQQEITREVLRAASLSQLFDHLEARFLPLDAEQLDLAATSGGLERSGSALGPNPDLACPVALPAPNLRAELDS
jgi:tRNA-dihydrouridine synthase